MIPRVVSYKTLLFIACVTWTQVCGAKEVVERTTLSFDAVQAEALRLADREGGPDSVLLVLDIDNTLLAMTQDLGSDQWFNWQRNLPDSNPHRVGDFDELLRVQALLYAIGSMRPTEPIRQPQIVRQLQEAGFTTLLLTSRGHNMRDSTRRELLANDYDFRKTSISPQEGFGGPYFPYDVTKIENSGLTADEAERWLADAGNPNEFETPREVSFNEGVYMVAGQHKGLMLRMLLHRSGNVNRFQHIVFVDDNAENTKDVREAFDNQSVNVVTFRYGREDANVRRFEENRNCEHHCAALALTKLQRALATMNVSKGNRPHPSSPAAVPTPQHVNTAP